MAYYMCIDYSLAVKTYEKFLDKEPTIENFYCSFHNIWLYWVMTKILPKDIAIEIITKYCLYFDKIPRYNYRLVLMAYPEKRTKTAKQRKEMMKYNVRSYFTSVMYRVNESA